MCLGVSGLSAVGSLMSAKLRGLVLTTAITSHKTVIKEQSSNILGADSECSFKNVSDLTLSQTTGMAGTGSVEMNLHWLAAR